MQRFRKLMDIRKLIMITSITLLFCSKSNHSFAQIYQCRDSTLPWGNSYCNPLDYEPVCGCNGKTYKNMCYMNKDGVQYTAPNSNGPCEPMDFFMYPTLINDDAGGIKLYIALQTTGDVQIFIIDYFGRQYFYRYLSNINSQIPPTPYPISVDNMQTGIYFLIVKTTSGYFKIKRFEKQNL